MAFIDLIIPHDANDPISLLKADHDRVRALLDAIQETGDRARVKRRALFAELRRLLVAHQRAEEGVLYPAAAAKREKLADIVQEGLQEHHVADLLLRELGRMDAGTPEWKAKAHVLGEGVRHHLGEEERIMFPKARLAFTRIELAALGRRLAQRRTQLLAREKVVVPKKAGRTKAGRTTAKAPAKASAKASTRAKRRGAATATGRRAAPGARRVIKPKTRTAKRTPVKRAAAKTARRAGRGNARGGARTASRSAGR